MSVHISIRSWSSSVFPYWLPVSLLLLDWYSFLAKQMNLCLDLSSSLVWKYTCSYCSQKTEVQHICRSDCLTHMDIIHYIFFLLQNYNCAMGWPQLAAKLSPICSLTPCLSGTGREEKIGTTGVRNLWVSIKTGRSLTDYCHRQNRLALEEMKLFIADYNFCQLNLPI